MTRARAGARTSRSRSRPTSRSRGTRAWSPTPRSGATPAPPPITPAAARSADRRAGACEQAARGALAATPVGDRERLGGGDRQPGLRGPDRLEVHADLRAPGERRRALVEHDPAAAALALRQLPALLGGDPLDRRAGLGLRLRDRPLHGRHLSLPSAPVRSCAGATR